MSHSHTVNYLASSHPSLRASLVRAWGQAGEALSFSLRRRGGGGGGVGGIISSKAISFPSLSRPGLQGATRCGAGNKGPLLHSTFGWGWVWGPETGGHFNGAVQPGVRGSPRSPAEEPGSYCCPPSAPWGRKATAPLPGQDHRGG